MKDLVDGLRKSRLAVDLIDMTEQQGTEIVISLTELILLFLHTAKYGN